MASSAPLASTPCPVSPSGSQSRDFTPSRSVTKSIRSSQPTYLKLACDALLANPHGLPSKKIVDWLEENRSEELRARDRDLESIKASIQATLSAQALKPEPKIFKWAPEGVHGRSGYIWTIQEPTLPTPASGMSESQTEQGTEVSCPPERAGSREESSHYEGVEGRPLLNTGASIAQTIGGPPVTEVSPEQHSTDIDQSSPSTTVSSTIRKDEDARRLFWGDLVLEMHKAQQDVAQYNAAADETSRMRDLADVEVDDLSQELRETSGEAEALERQAKLLRERAEKARENLKVATATREQYTSALSDADRKRSRASEYLGNIRKQLKCE